MSNTIHPDISVPEEHLAMSIPGPTGTFWLYGFRGHDTVARFTIISEGATPEDSPDVMLHNGEWLAAWKYLHGVMKPSHVESTLRSVLPTA